MGLINTIKALRALDKGYKAIQQHQKLIETIKTVPDTISRAIKTFENVKMMIEDKITEAKMLVLNIKGFLK